MLAAHCVTKIPKSWKLKRVRVGEWDLKSEIDCDIDDETFCATPPIDNEVEEIKVYPSYSTGSRDQHSDIVLLRLKREVVFNEFVKPICLPLYQELNTRDFTGSTFEVAG